MVKYLSLLFIFLLVSGCSSSKKIIVSSSADDIPVVTGSVLNSLAFEKGGTLVLGSFKPGTGAEANDETDQLSLMMIKGIKDTLLADNLRFTISEDDQKKSDFYLEGHIEDYGRDVHFTHLKLRQNQVHLSIDGEIWLRETGEKVFLFKSSALIDLKIKNSKIAAYQMGVAIARLLGSK
ncbi:MAG: hypothetical protein HQL12_08595 [Candidatus Omnitrophica bacterium]|nr:hypothetical protein [Candidatus Omnitrophota bacterium]